jgi:hypothetical protein
MTTDRKRYDINLLNKCILDGNALLIGEYTKITRNIDIIFRCMCGIEPVKKNFRQLEKTGAKCDTCIEKQKNTRRKATCINTYGVPSASKDPKVKEKTADTFRQNLLLRTDSLCVTNQELLKEWDYNKNEKRPADFTAGSNVSVWWKCEKLKACGCLHEWEAVIYSRTTRKTGCPWCSNTHCCSHNSIVTTHPDIAAQWHPTKNGDLKPDKVSHSSDREVWWLCTMTCPKGCRHEFKSTIGNRTNGNKCPYCCPQHKKVSCVHTSIVSTHTYLMKEWNFTMNTINPETIGYGSHESVYWKCEYGHEWQAIIYSRVSGNGCPRCKPKYSKPQIQYLNFIQVSQPSIQHALNNGEHRIKHSRYFADGYISESNTIIEFHGCYWHGCKKCYNETDINTITKSSFAELNKKTVQKKQHCIDNGYIYSEIWGCQWNRAINSVINLQRLYRKFKLPPSQ